MKIAPNKWGKTLAPNKGRNSSSQKVNLASYKKENNSTQKGK